MWFEIGKGLSFILLVLNERAPLDFRYISIHIQNREYEIFLKLYIVIPMFWTMFWPRVVLVSFPEHCHLWHGECWWCSISEKHIPLLVPRFSSKLLIPILQDDAGLYWPHQEAGRDNHITAATYWRWLWNASLYMWEHGCLRTSALWCSEGGSALLACLSNPEFNSQMMSLYISNEVSWHPVSRDTVHYWTTLKKFIKHEFLFSVKIEGHGHTFCIWYIGFVVTVNIVFENWHYVNIALLDSFIWAFW